MAQQNQVNPAQQNAAARSIVLASSVERIQNVFSQTVAAGTQNTINVIPRNVGLIKGFFIDIEADFTVGATTAVALTKLGAANILKQVNFVDLQNNTRIQTTGWHLHLVNTARQSAPYGICNALDGSPVGYDNNFDVMSAPAAPAGGATGKIKMRYYVPLAYSDYDLRGAVYAGVVNATQNLQLVINKEAFVASGDATEAVYVGNSGVVGNVKINVYQHYLDQLPIGPQGPILPLQDLSTIYELKNTTLTSMQAGQDFPIPYSNFRSFLSTFAVYDNGGALNAGSDINYWALTSANFTNLFKYGPNESALLSRNRIGVDYPAGVYYFDHRAKPLNTIQYGNLELNLNAATVGANSKILVGFEDFAMINVVSGAGSLPAGG